MKFIHRVGNYLGGFSIGLFILTFFLKRKKTSYDYGLNSRTTTNIANNTVEYYFFKTTTRATVLLNPRISFRNQ